MDEPYDLCVRGKLLFSRWCFRLLVLVTLIVGSTMAAMPCRGSTHAAYNCPNNDIECCSSSNPVLPCCDYVGPGLYGCAADQCLESCFSEDSHCLNPSGGCIPANAFAACNSINVVSLVGGSILAAGLGTAFLLIFCRCISNRCVKRVVWF